MRRFLLAWTWCLALAPFAAAHAAIWAPPENPDPQAILRETRADLRARNYELALAKHVWFHEHALEHQPSLSAVRRSFALSYWLELGEAYPPALDKLKAVRDEALKRVTPDGDRRITFEDFHDLAALNRTLEQESITVDAFKRLDADRPEVAQRMFHVSRAALIKAKEYEICGKYIDADQSVNRIVTIYETTSRLEQKNPLLGDRHKDFRVKKFLNEAATLVALLAVNDRRDEAEKAARELAEVEGDGEFHAKLKAELDKALEGTAPEPWP